MRHTSAGQNMNCATFNESADFMSHRRRPGFALAEAVALASILALAACILLPAAAESRRGARLNESIANLRSLGQGASSFSADNDDRIATFFWRAGEANSQFPDLNFSANDLEAAANQAIDIIRRRSSLTTMPSTNNWIPHLLYSHLVLEDYLDRPLPDRMVISPSDGNRVAWQRSLREDPTGAAFFQLPNRPLGNDPLMLRWIFSSSYEMSPAHFAPDAGSGNMQTVSQANTHNLYFVGANTPFGMRHESEVSFPANKVFLYDSVQRDLGRRVVFFAFPEARVPALMHDGSAGLRSTSAANRGFQPNNPQSPLPSQFQYAPNSSWEPPAPNGSPNALVNGYYRWTRSGLKGADWDRSEVQWHP